MRYRTERRESKVFGEEGPSGCCESMHSMARVMLKQECRTDKSRGSSHRTPKEVAQAQFSCDSLVEGLSLEDCEHMASIGMFSQGDNSFAEEEDPHGTWIGDDGPNTFCFINKAGVPLTIVLWNMGPDDDQASFMNVRAPKITYSLPSSGDSVIVSLANGVAGGFSAIWDRTTTLSQWGMIDNTMGEFSTGAYATIDVSRLVNMSGNSMTVFVQGGCVASMSRCVYQCSGADSESCGDAGTYELVGCWGLPNAVSSVDKYGNPTGGCQGWSYGGHVDIVLT
ncbi:hypothetical protein QBC39DRAFT_46941 [Podospora conica]|nr:hypothetical protein QBC39DRAFT_46941 [Schizothecium conicum]